MMYRRRVIRDQPERTRSEDYFRYNTRVKTGQAIYRGMHMVRPGRTLGGTDNLSEPLHEGAGKPSYLAGYGEQDKTRPAGRTLRNSMFNPMF
jgi:hypothetical protein